VRALKRGLFHPTPTRIVWVYGESQQQAVNHELDSARNLPRIEYLRNATDYEEIMEGFDPAETNLLVLDDQMNEGKAKANAFANLFTKGSHHRNITVVYMMQNVFEKGGSNRTINLNAHYLIMFKNPRDGRQAHVLGSQMYPKNPSFLSQAFEDATSSRAHSYLALEFRQETDRLLRVLTNITADDDEPVTVYVPRDDYI
jgi:hypothetical protein